MSHEKSSEEKPEKKTCEEKTCEDKPEEKTSEEKTCDKKPCDKKPQNKYASCIEEQWFRKIGKTATPFLHSWLGNYYWLLHAFIMLSSGTVLLFDNNVYHLLILFNVTCMDAVACIFLHDCPLTVLEQKYMKTSVMQERTKCFNRSPFLYRCNHVYEQTLEFLTNMTCFILGKICYLLILKSLDIKFAPVE